MTCNCICHSMGKPFCEACWDKHEHEDDEYPATYLRKNDDQFYDVTPPNII